MPSFIGRVRRGLGSAGQRALGDRYPAARAEIAARVTGRLSPLQQADALRSSRLFDVAYYEAQTGKTFSSPTLAARDFVREGMARNFTFHPLVEPTYLPAPIRKAHREGDIAAVLGYLGEEPTSEAWGPLFGRDALSTGRGFATPRDYLVALDSDGVIVPAPLSRAGEVGRWADTREALLAIARDIQHQTALRQPHRFTEWDEKAEREWLDALPDAPALPDTDGPRVSVLIPVRNRPALIARALASIQEQDMSDWEAIVIDDGSDDDTPAVVEAMIASDPRIRLIRSDHRGVSAARNRGIEAAQSTYIAFLDSDNTWRPGFLSTMLNGLRTTGCRAAFAAASVTNSKDEVSYLGSPVTYEQLLYQNYLDLNTFVVERTAIEEVGDFDEKLRRWVDHDLFIRLARRTELRFFPFIGCDYTHDTKTVRISNVESPNWQWVVADKNLVDWADVEARVDERVPGRVSVLCVSTDKAHGLLQSLDSTIDDDSLDIEVVIVDNGSQRGTSAALRAAYLANPRVTMLRLPLVVPLAVATNIAVAASTGETIVFLDQEALPRPNWLVPLIDELSTADTRAVQSVIANLDGTVFSAGLVYPIVGGQPMNFLGGHPLDDARAHDGRGLPGLSGIALAARARDVVALHGYDPMYVDGYEDADFCFRLTGEEAILTVRSDSLVVLRDARLAHRARREYENRRVFHGRWYPRMAAAAAAQWEKVGFEVPHIAPPSGTTHDARPIVIRPPRLTDDGRRSLRWAIKIGAEFNTGGDKWGDVPYAADLAAALRRHGQNVVVDRHLAAARASSYLDDVVLALRGLHPVEPQPGKVNVMWVISRPELVTPREVSSFDLVYAASPKWAAYMSEMSGRPVEVMLQATNPRRFNYLRSEGEKPVDEVLFVGGPRPPVGRRIVNDAIEVGLPVRVWGPRWGQFVDEKHVAGDFISNDDVSMLYSRARFVLNDHFDDMAEWGFINNRLFDAVAAGARVISDHVDGIDELFHEAVRTYRTTDELAALTDSPETAFPDEARRRELADLVARDHSFEARADVFIDAVSEVIARR
ncbi:glycosyltransferase [Labedella endophytica]|uniref:Glycosyltransferase n=1 Tax=Labedella endophytica TaxID=1523160 RepID=A0A3S1CU00_9MICO|nr:glycosyltransferase [Labedella endophytica]RUR03040.1 glycosyltransferase [Labedella endophytica]